MVATENILDNTAKLDNMELVGPFTEISQDLVAVLWKLLAHNVPGSLHWSMLLVTLALAVVLYWDAQILMRKIGI